MSESTPYDWTSIKLIPIDTPEYSWLTAYVLTNAIRRTYECDPDVVVHQQAFLPLSADEQNHLKVSKGYLREVVIRAEGSPIVYARTAVMSASLEVKRALVSLGTKPIGESILYNNAKVTRSPFSYLRIKAIEKTYPQSPIPFHSQLLWARKSTFRWGLTQILISEFFSPTIRCNDPANHITPLIRRLPDTDTTRR